MKLLAKPVVSLALGLLLGVGVGLGLFMQQARLLVKAAKAAQLEAAKGERPAKPWDFWTLEIENLASELKDQKEALASRERLLAAREERLVTAQNDLKKSRDEIDAIRAEISGKMTFIKEDELKNLKALAKSYSDVTPKAAISIIHEMDEDTVVKILVLMKSDILSALLDTMGKSSDPAVIKQAARLTERLRMVNLPVSAPPAP